MTENTMKIPDCLNSDINCRSDNDFESKEILFREVGKTKENDFKNEIRFFS